MKTIDNFLCIIKSDSEIQKLLSESKELKRKYKPRTHGGRPKSRSTEQSITLKYFWNSIDGAKLRLLFEQKYELNMANRKLRSKLKDALILYLGGLQ